MIDMKKIEKIGLIVILVVIALIIILFQIDYIVASNTGKPIFCIQVRDSEEDSATEYLGLGYKLISFNRSSGYKGIKSGICSMKYEDFKSEYEALDKWVEETTILEVSKDSGKIYIEIKEETEELKKLGQDMYNAEDIMKSSNSRDEYVFSFYKGSIYEENMGVEIDNGEYYINYKGMKQKLNKDKKDRIVEIIDKYTKPKK